MPASSSLRSGRPPRPGPTNDTLHRIIDVAIDYFEVHPEFSRIVHQLRGGLSAGPALGEPEDVTGLVDQADEPGRGPRRGRPGGGSSIRPGDPRAMAHLYEVIVHEHVILADADNPHAANLSRSDLHDFVDGALRAPG